MGHILNLSNFTKAFRYLKKNGLGAAFSAVEERILQERSQAEEAGVNGTCSRYQPPTETELDAQRRRSCLNRCSSALRCRLMKPILFT
ncbi:MAG: hypothetical protein ACLVLH_27085 [Eisenbergiella massiliensis]